MLGLVLVTPAAAAGPDVQVKSPTNGATIDGSNVTVSFEVVDFKLVPSTVPLTEAGKHPEANKPGEGHMHFTLDLEPLVVWDKNEPYTFTNVPPGEHQLVVDISNNDHAPLSPPVTKTIKFRTTGQGLPRAGEQPLSTTGLLAVVLGSLGLVYLGFALRRRLL
jgi:hypothetical protein